MDHYERNCGDPLIVEVPNVWFRSVNAGSRSPFTFKCAAVDSAALVGTVQDLLDAVMERYSGSLLAGVAACNLLVFADANARIALGVEDHLNRYGAKSSDPLIVEVPEIWFELIDADTGRAFLGTCADSALLAKK